MADKRFTFSLWDIFKSAFVVFLAVVIWTKGDAWIDKVTRPEQQGPGITEPQITRIAENVIKLQNAANEARFDALEERLKESNSQALAVAQQYAEENDAKITALGETVSSLNTSFNELSASEVYEDPELPTRTYERFDLSKEMADGKQMPLGWVKYHPFWEGDDKLVEYYYPIEYKTTIIRSEHKDGTFTYDVETWAENNFLKSTRGIKYPLDLDNIEFEEKPITEKSFSFNPRFGLGGGVTTESIFPTLDFSLFSYGKTNVDMDWRFLSFGIGMEGANDNEDNSLVGTFSPVQYNIGKPLPYIENIFLAPVFTINTNSETGYGATLTIPF